MTNLPSQPTPFVGREAELIEISGLLTTAACRLLTLTGPGGIGKTRLALEAAHKIIGTFRNGVFFVPLQPIASPEFIVTIIADALRFAFYGGDDPKSQLLGYLREKQVLLVLDNFEHLMDGADLLSEILEVAPDVKLLVTSRERLNLREEWVFDVYGLSFPEIGHNSSLQSYSAAQLFVQSAQRVGYTSAESDTASIGRICQMVEGIPLAIELAAAWVRAMPCAEIAREIESSLNILTTSTRNMPEKHRSMRATFEQSWRLLTEDEQTAFRKLSVFRGGFTREAAAQVANALLPTVAALVDKSLLRLEVNGRYQIHELLRQYGETRLSESSQAADIAYRHLEYFGKLAEQAEAHIYGPEQVSWFDRLEVEHDNLRAALSWSLTAGQGETGLRLASALTWFWKWRFYNIEGIRWLEQLLEAAPHAPVTLRAKTLIYAAEIGCFVRDRAEVTQALLQQALALAQTANDHWNMAWALGGLGFYDNMRRTDLNQAANLLEESLALFRELGDGFGQSHMLRRRAMLAMDQDDYTYARLLVEEALAQAREAGDQNTIAWTLYLLGCVLWSLDQDYGQVRNVLQESLSVFRAVRDMAEYIYPLTLLAGVEQAVGHYQQAHDLYVEGLVLIRDMGATATTDLDPLLAGLGSLAMELGKLEQAAILLGIVDASPEGQFYFRAGYPMYITFADNVASVRGKLGEEAFAKAWAAGQAMTAEPAITYALSSDKPEVAPSQQPASQSLADPLTERELDILRLLASGLSTREVAQQLFLTVGTVKWYLNQIYSKLAVHSRIQAIGRARELKLLA